MFKTRGETVVEIINKITIDFNSVKLDKTMISKMIINWETL